MEERLLKMPEVTARLSLSRTAIYRLMAQGDLQPVRIGGALRFTASDIDQFIEDLKGDHRAKAV